MATCGTVTAVITMDGPEAAIAVGGNSIDRNKRRSDFSPETTSLFTSCFNKGLPTKGISK